MENIIIDLMRELKCNRETAQQALNRVLTNNADLRETIIKKATQERKFIQNIYTVEVDGLRSVNHYKVYGEYEVKYMDEQNKEYWKTEWNLIDEFDYAWDDIEQDGGIAQVNKDIQEEYNAIAK